MPTTQCAQEAATTNALASISSFTVSRVYTDRSNCRKAMLKFAASQDRPATDFVMKTLGPRDYRYQIAESKSEESIPAALIISPEERAAAWKENLPKAVRAPAITQEADMARKTSTTTKATARRPVAPKTTTPREGSRSRYDWTGAEEMAEKGKIPPALDFSAPTHARFRDALAEVVKAAKASDAKALAAIKINPVSSSPKALDRYRSLCLKAVKAKGSAAA